MDPRIEITASKITDFNKPVDAPTAAAATSTTANQAEQFKYKPTASAFILKGTSAASHGAVKYDIFAGTDKATAPKVISGEFAQGKTQAIQIDTYDVVGADGTITIEATPASGKKLYTDHAFTISAEEVLSVG